VYTQFLKRGISQLKVIGTIMMRVTGTNWNCSYIWDILGMQNLCQSVHLYPPCIQQKLRWTLLELKNPCPCVHVFFAGVLIRSDVQGQERYFPYLESKGKQGIYLSFVEYSLTPKCQTYDCGIRLSIDTKFCHLIFR
jgi:hypothetical protein